MDNDILVAAGSTTLEFKGQTVMTEEERCESVRQCRYVDEVICPAPWCITMEFLKEHNVSYSGFPRCRYFLWIQTCRWKEKIFMEFLCESLGAFNKLLLSKIHLILDIFKWFLYFAGPQPYQNDIFLQLYEHWNGSILLLPLSSAFCRYYVN